MEQNESYPLLARALRVRKEHIACRAAAAATLKGVRLCCDAALANDGGPLFDAGDDGPVALPPKFGAVAEGVVRAREICRRYDYEADKRVKEEGWPPPKESGPVPRRARPLGRNGVLLAVQRFYISRRLVSRRGLLGLRTDYATRGHVRAGRGVSFTEKKAARLLPPF